MKNKDADKLKNFIAVCDKAVFPKTPAPVYVLNRRNFRGRKATAQYFHDSIIYSGHLHYSILELIPKLIQAALAYFFLAIPVVGYTDSIKRKYYRNFLGTIHQMRTYRRNITKQCYEVNVSHLPLEDDILIAIVAWHEVRHRVQRRYAFKDLFTEEKKRFLIEIFNEKFKDNLEKDVRKADYSEREIPLEVDANYIAYLMGSYFSKEYGDSTLITEEQLFAFTKKYYNLMAWKNPEISIPTPPADPRGEWWDK